jgi:LPXTG-motif cell wall-anchored protein
MCCGIGLVAGVLAFRAQADPWDKKTILTVNKTIQVQDRVLPAGTYVFKLLDSPSNRHVVQIFNEDQSHIIDTVLAIPNYRLQPTGHSRFLFYETPPGAAPALHAWFYPGDNFGQEFRYPKHLAMLETTQQTESSRITKQVEETKREETAEAAPPPPPAPPAEEKQEERTEIAQAAPPPPPAAPEPAPAATPAETPKQLPKTASPFPLVGLGGLLSMGLGGLLRLKRRS